MRTFENPAITQFLSTSIGSGMRLFLLKPHTGKTHQLRVALKSIGAPILGDSLYHPTRDDCRQMDRAYLHCYALRFQMLGETLRYQCKPDSGEYFYEETFLQALRKYENPWTQRWPKLKF
jgi:tRNA pseudouridine32 synthase/23S rRNA pseudouridine746 synthase